MGQPSMTDALTLGLSGDARQGGTIRAAESAWGDMVMPSSRRTTLAGTPARVPG